MDIWTPCIVLEILHRDPEWHDFQTPHMLGHYRTEDEAMIVLLDGLEKLSNALKLDPSPIMIDSYGRDRKDTRFEKRFYFNDRLITINGYMYHGKIE